jgi:hypothetical protein
VGLFAAITLSKISKDWPIKRAHYTVGKQHHENGEKEKVY